MTIMQGTAGYVPQALRLGTTQNVAVGAASAQNTAFGANTQHVRLVSTTDCWIAVGANPTATTASTFLPANAIEYFAILSGEKVAVIQNTAAGTLNITECA